MIFKITFNTVVDDEHKTKFISNINKIHKLLMIGAKKKTLNHELDQ